jgi:hypothetical protein
VSKANLVGRYLRASAWWRLDSAGASAIQVARSVVALLDAAVFMCDIPDDDPDLAALAEAGWFSGAAFDPGPEGVALIRGWHLHDEATTGPRDLLRALAHAATHRPLPRGGDGACAPAQYPASTTPLPSL